MIPRERADEWLWTIRLDRAGRIHMDLARPVTKAAMAAMLREIAEGLETGDLMQIEGDTL